MMKKLGLAVALVMGAGLLLVPGAHAGCIPATFASNLGAYQAGPGTTFCYSYLKFPGDASGDTTDWVARWWQTDEPSNNESGMPPSDWIFHPGPPYGDYYWYFYLDTGGADTCPTGLLTVYIEDPNTTDGGSFIVWTVDEQGPGKCTGAWDFDYTTAPRNAPEGLGFQAAPSPRPRVDSSSRSGTTVTVNYTVPDPTAGHYSRVSAGQITDTVVFSTASEGKPSLDVSAGWTERQRLGPNGGSGSIELDCSDTTKDQWLATGLEIDNNAARFVSTPVQIECDPALAEPPKFKMIDKPKPGHKPKIK